MNIIKRIKIENIKGKDKWELTFDDFNANQPNIIVAPNGYGKSTLAVAFEAASKGRMKLKPQDYYMQDVSNHPMLEIELLGEHNGVYTSTDSEGGISKSFTVYTINSPLYAKNTTRGFGGNTAATADLRVEDVIVFDQIPPKAELNYSYSKLRDWFSDKAKLFENISKMLLSYHNIDLLLSNIETIKKCCTQKKIQNKMSTFLSDCSDKGTAKSIKSSISDKKTDELYSFPHLQDLLKAIDDMEGKDDGWEKIDTIFTAIQICRLMTESNNLKELKRVHQYLYFKQVKSTLDERLKLFNTTGREMTTHEKKSKLVVSFERAEAMSNGERDVLSFISNLTKFEVVFNKLMGILLIDEVFDYLDGSKLLIVQYYLSELINRIKREKRILFPIIFTHLDPYVFSNYYFSTKNIHYISCHSQININSPIVKLLQLRNSNNGLKNEIETYYIHYHDQEHFPSEQLKSQMGNSFKYSNFEFKALLFDEIQKNYLSESDNNKIVGIRLKIEELIYNKLCPENRADYISTHTVIKKLKYAKELGIDVPELYYLLQPLYNDALHLENDNKIVKRKIKSGYLKTSCYKKHSKYKNIFKFLLKNVFLCCSMQLSYIYYKWV